MTPDDEELARFRADEADSQYVTARHSTDSEPPRLAEAEVQERWAYYLYLFQHGYRMVQRKAIIQETRL